MKKQILYGILALLSSQQIVATQLIQGNVKPVVAESGNCPTNVTTTFNVSVNTVTYDRAHGIFWVGLADGAGEYALSSFQRTIDSSQIPVFKPHAPNNSAIHDKSIGMLTMATGPGDTQSQVAGVIAHENSVFLSTLQNKFTQSNALNLYSTFTQPVDTASVINGLIANGRFIFAPVSHGTFGLDNSGIAVIAMNPTTNALTQTAAVPGDPEIKAQQLDNLSPFIRINANPLNPNYPTIQSDNPQLFWDDQLSRLYMGVSLASNTSTQVAHDGLRSIVVGQVGMFPEMGTLTLFDSAPSSAFNTNDNNIVGGTLSSNGQSMNLTVQNLGVIHASSGPSYLIVNGGNGTGTNQIFALPLVDLNDPSNVNQGVLADKNIFNTITHRFEMPATVNDSLATTTDSFAMVGTSTLPINQGQTPSGMFVIDDAVYVSLQIPQDNNNETGILYSQALFDSEGKITSWTPWSKRVWPFNGFPDSPSSSQVSFFAVDGVTGKVIAVDSTKQTVRITEWVNEQPTADPCQNRGTLPFVLNQSLCSGAYSVLDLDQTTRGIGPTIPYRYALFGGTDKVDIALVSTSRATTAPYDINPSTGQPYPQTVTLNYCNPCNQTTFEETTLPSDAGCATSLEYARRTTTEGNTNYFFAGTENGLFVFAHEDGSGFNVNELGFTNTGVLATGSWQAIPTITDPVIDIKTSGNRLYVLTFATSCDAPLQSTLLSIPFTDNINTMFAPGNISIIAQSGSTSPTPVLQNTLVFTAIDIIQTSTTGSQEQLVLATNNGIFQSKAINGVQSVTNATDAQWTSLGNNSLFYGIGSVDNAPIKTTDWPFNAQDACGYGTFERSSIYQLNGNNNVNTFQFVPSFFNYYIDPCDVNDSCCQPVLFQKIAYFWSDGGRRFFIIAPTNAHIAGIPCCGKKSCCCSAIKQLRQLEVTPFNLCEWGICDPAQTVLQDCVLRNTPLFYWVRPIGMTGLLLAGTSYGVVALE